MFLALLLRHFSKHYETTVLPTSLLLSLVGISFDALSDRFALEPAAIIDPSIWPSLHSISFGLPVNPLADVDLTIGELALAR